MSYRTFPVRHLVFPRCQTIFVLSPILSNRATLLQELESREWPNAQQLIVFQCRQDLERNGSNGEFLPAQVVCLFSAGVEPAGELVV